jgi:hypothetical protein
MSNRTRRLLSGALLPCALLCGLIGTAPARADEASLAAFTLATCRNSIDDLAKVGAMAGEQNWTAEADAGSFGSLWKVTQDGDKIMVGTKVEGDVKMCAVMFPEANVQRNGFFKAISAAEKDMERVGTFTAKGGRMEMFMTKQDDRPALMFQLMTLGNGKVLMASFISAKAN